MPKLHIAIDHDGYADPDSLQELAESCAGELNDEVFASVLDAIADYFNDCGFGSARRRGTVWRFATGGWSGCEEVLSRMPIILHSVAWRSSHRGGLHVYGLDRA